MFIAVVGPGETLEIMAARLGITETQLINANRLPSNEVTQGEALLVPSNRYVVQPGDSLYSIAQNTGVPLERLIRANPGTVRGLYPGRSVRIPPIPRQAAEVIGYLPLTDPGVTADDITRWGIPFTYIALFSHLITDQGDLTPLDDTEAIRTAYAAGAKPLMSIANMRPGGTFDPELAGRMITDQDVRRRVMEGILQIVEAKGYAGVDADIENVPQDLRMGYVDFLRELKARLGDRTLNVAVAPKYDETSFAYARGHDYAGIGQVADRVYLMNHEFSWVGGPPGAIAPLPQTRRVMQYAASLIPREKLLNGISTTAYDWELPDTPENRARPLSADEAVQIAVRHQVPIRYSETADAPWFRYTEDGTEREVWFEDARSIMAKFLVVRNLGLRGIGIWQLSAMNSALAELIGAFFSVAQ